MKDTAIALGSKAFHELPEAAQRVSIAALFNLGSMPNWRQLAIDYRQEQLEREVKQAHSPKGRSPYTSAQQGASATPAPNRTGNTPKLILKSEAGCVRHWLHRSDPTTNKKCPESTCNFKHELPYNWKRTIADQNVAKYFKTPSRGQDRAPLEAYVERNFTTVIADKKLNAIRLANMVR